MQVLYAVYDLQRILQVANFSFSQQYLLPSKSFEFFFLLSKLLYMLLRGSWDRFVGQCLLLLGAGCTVFPEHGGLGHLSQASPVQPVGKRQQGGPGVAVSPP